MDHPCLGPDPTCTIRQNPPGLHDHPGKPQDLLTTPHHPVATFGETSKGVNQFGKPMGVPAKDQKKGITKPAHVVDCFTFQATQRFQQALHVADGQMVVEHVRANVQLLSQVETSLGHFFLFALYPPIKKHGSAAPPLKGTLPHALAWFWVEYLKEDVPTTYFCPNLTPFV